MRRFKRTAVMAMAMSIALSVAACSSSTSAGGSNSLRMQLFPGNIASFYPLIAQKEGMFKQNKLNVSLTAVGTSPQALAAMLAGSLDIVPSTPDGFLLAKAKGTNAVAVAANTQQPVFQIVASSKYVSAGGDLASKVAAMKGQPIAVYGRGGTSDRFVDFLFKTNSISSTPDYVIAGAAKTVAAFLANRVAFASDTIQIADLLEAAGKGGTYIDCAVDNCAPGSEGNKQQYWTTATFANSHAATLKAFIAALNETSTWVHDPANKDKVIADIKQFYPAPAGVDNDKYAALLYQSQLTMFNGTGFSQSDIEASMNGLMNLGQLTSPVDVKSMIWPQAPTR